MMAIYNYAPSSFYNLLTIIIYVYTDPLLNIVSCPTVFSQIH